MKPVKIVIMTAILAIIVSFCIEAEARGFGPGFHKGGRGCGLPGMRAFLELKLTESQQNDMLKIFDKYSAERETLFDRISKARNGIKKAMHSEEFNENALRNAFREASSVKEDMFLLRARMMDELKGTLSPEQLKLLEERKGKMHRFKKARPCQGSEKGSE